MAKYAQMTDEELIRRYREGDKDALDHIMEKYKDQVRREANAMYLLGGENEDLIQEGMIGLFKAVQDYDVRQEASFFSFARLCHRPGSTSEESIIGSKVYESILYANLRSSGTSSRIWLKSNGLRACVEGSCFMPIVPPVYMSRSDALRVWSEGVIC